MSSNKLQGFSGGTHPARSGVATLKQSEEESCYTPGIVAVIVEFRGSALWSSLTPFKPFRWPFKLLSSHVVLGFCLLSSFVIQGVWEIFFGSPLSAERWFGLEHFVMSSDVCLFKKF